MGRCYWKRSRFRFFSPRFQDRQKWLPSIPLDQTFGGFCSEALCTFTGGSMETQWRVVMFEIFFGGHGFKHRLAWYDQWRRVVQDFKTNEDILKRCEILQPNTFPEAMGDLLCSSKNSRRGYGRFSWRLIHMAIRVASNRFFHFPELLEQLKRPWGLGYIGDEILPNSVGTMS